MALFANPFDALLGLQQALDAFRGSGWLDAGPSGGGAYPPVNVFRKGDGVAVIAEVPGVRKSDLEVQVKGSTLRISGAKAVGFPRGGGRAPARAPGRAVRPGDRAALRGRRRGGPGRVPRRPARPAAAARGEDRPRSVKVT
jgi:hypothetical protein